MKKLIKYTGYVLAFVAGVCITSSFYVPALVLGLTSMGMVIYGSE